jgi:AcrR family transcriptional regulator
MYIFGRSTALAPKDRRAREREEVRKLILKGACELIKKDGYEKLTIRAIADRVEYSPMALYNHFPDKDAILIELAEDGFAELVKKIPTSTRLSPLAALKRGMLAYVTFGLKHPDEYRLVFMTTRIRPAAPGGAEDETAIRSTTGRVAFEMLKSLVQRCAATDERFADSFAVSRVLWAGIHGVTSLLITVKNFPFGSADKFAQEMVDVLINGLPAPPQNSATRSKRVQAT